MNGKIRQTCAQRFEQAVGYKIGFFGSQHNGEHGVFETKCNDSERHHGDKNTDYAATKFVNVAREFYAASGTDIDIIHLNGSIELAPILGLSDVIVDLVETGTTLRENNLEVVDVITEISARLISNKSSFKFRNKEIENIVAGLAKVVESRREK